MAPTGILDIPIELLDQIYSYLDWNRSASLCPIRSDLLHISLTCRQLRQTVLPLIFRNVTLCLRWADGVLLEPALYRLRRQRPDLAQHVRCVFVITALGRYRPGAAYDTDVPAFRVPEDTDDWLNPEVAMWPGSRHYAELNAAHRKRVDCAVRSVLASNHDEYRMGEGQSSAEVMVRNLVERTRRSVSNQSVESLSPPSRHAHNPSASANKVHLAENIGSSVGSTEETSDIRNVSHVAWRSKVEAQKLKTSIDALAAVMLCLPATVTELVFDAGVHGKDNAVWYTFATQLGLAAMRVFGPRLETLTMATVPGSRSISMWAPSTNEDHVDEETLVEITSLRRLVLACTAAPPGTFSVQNMHMFAAQLEPWKAATITSTVTSLEVWNAHFTDTELQQLVDFAKAFQALKVLTFRNVGYTSGGMPFRNPIQHAAGPLKVVEATWLHFAILLRRAIPLQATIIFSDIECKRGCLPDSALHWLMKEAVPAASLIDLQREERLSIDFHSYLDLWRAEDGERGRLAREERKSGELVEAAMCSRWKLFANVRKDQGEWTTI